MFVPSAGHHHPLTGVLRPPKNENAKFALNYINAILKNEQIKIFSCRNSSSDGEECMEMEKEIQRMDDFKFTSHATLAL